MQGGVTVYRWGVNGELEGVSMVGEQEKKKR